MPPRSTPSGAVYAGGLYEVNMTWRQEHANIKSVEEIFVCEVSGLPTALNTGINGSSNMRSTRDWGIAAF